MSEFSTQCFRDPVWLEHNPLNAQTALEYFSHSGFYDRNCNNETIKMQQASMDQLKNMRGTEYELLHANEMYGVFAIRRNERESPSVAPPRAAYYIVGGTVFQAPDIHTVLTNRLRQAVLSATEAFELAAEHVRYDARSASGYSWAVDDAGLLAESSSEPGEDDCSDSEGGDTLTFHRRRDERKRRKDLFLLDGALRNVLPHFPSGIQAGAVRTVAPSSVGSSAVPSRSSSHADLPQLDDHSMP